MSHSPARPHMQEPALVTGTGGVYAISLADTKKHVRAADSDDDDVLSTLIVAAHEKVSGPNGDLGKVLITETWRVDFDKFPGKRRLDLPFGPIQSVVVQYSDSDNVNQTFSSANYAVQEDACGPYLWLDEGQTSWPDTYDRQDAVRVSVTAGYGDTAADVPAHIKMALYHIVAYWFAQREPVGDGRELPLMALKLLHNDKQFAF